MSRGPDRSRAALARDAALARIGRTRRWVIAGAAALTAAIAALVSSVAPGRTLGAKPAVQTEASSAAPTQRVARNGLPKMPAPAGAAQLGLQGPTQAPAPVPDPQPQSTPPQPQSAAAPQPSGPVVSGGS